MIKNDYFKKELDKTNPAQKPTIDLFETVHKIAKKKQPEQSLEVGIAWAITTIAILTATERGKLMSVDAAFYPNTERQVQHYKYTDRWMFVERTSQEFLPELVRDRMKFDLICIDGSHTYEDVKIDMINAMKLLKDDGVLIVDDYKHKHNWDGDYGVARAVNETIKDYNMKFKIYNKAHGIVEMWR